MRVAFVSLSLMVCGCAPLSAQMAMPRHIAAGGPPSHVGTADFNGDGKMDLWITRGNVETNAPGSVSDSSLATATNGSVAVLLGRGDGTFAQAWNTMTVGMPQSAVAIDVNGDGRPDLAVAEGGGGGTVAVYLGKGDGSFVQPTILPAGGSAASIRQGDVNGDGKIDLVLLDRRPNPAFQGGKLVVLLGHGDGSFDAARSQPVGRAPESIALGDYNGDGRLDVAVADPRQMAILVMMGNGDGTFVHAGRVDTTFAPLGLASAQIDKDGKVDISVGSAEGSQIYLGNGDGSFRHIADYYVGPTRSGFSADFDGDGNLDLVTGRRLLRGDGTGHFFVTELPQSDNTDSWVSAADFNNDGFIDLVAADLSHSRIDVYLNRGSGKVAIQATR
jgi:hypothetical protein